MKCVRGERVAAMKLCLAFKMHSNNDIFIFKNALSHPFVHSRLDTGNVMPMQAVCNRNKLLPGAFLHLKTEEAFIKKCHVADIPCISDRDHISL